MSSRLLVAATWDIGARRSAIEIFRNERAASIGGRAKRRSAAEDELVGWEARSLIGLEHVVGPAVGLRQREVGIQNARGVVHEKVSSIIRRCFVGSVHLAQCR